MPTTRWVALGAVLLLLPPISLIAIRGAFSGTDERAVCERAVRDRDWVRLEQAAAAWLERDVTNGDAWLYLARAAEERGDAAWAAAALARVPDSHPEAVRALHRHLALTSGPLDRPLEAERSLERLLTLDPKNPDVHRQAIAYYAETFQRARLLEQVRQSIGLECEPPEAYVYLAAADGRLVVGRPSRYKQWVAAHPDCPMFGAAQALCLTREAGLEPGTAILAGEQDRELSRALALALVRFPDNPELLAFEIERAIARKDPTRVTELLNRAPPRTRDDDRYWRYAAWLYRESGAQEEAEAACRHALSLHPLSWKTRRLLASLLSESQPDDAQQLLALAHDGERLHERIVRMDTVEPPPVNLLEQIAAYATACDDRLVAAGIARHLAPPSRAEGGRSAPWSE